MAAVSYISAAVAASANEHIAERCAGRCLRGGVQQGAGAGQVLHAVDVVAAQQVQLGQVAAGLGLADQGAGGTQQLLGQGRALDQPAHGEQGVHLALDQEPGRPVVADRAGDGQVGVGRRDRFVGLAPVRHPVHLQGEQVQRPVRGDRHRQPPVARDRVRHQPSIRLYRHE
ncbi:hypothetical protein GCM10020358_09490 [Amorphoplanes nipponensis]|uniref:hypothetical protein n=1 Tax=Actinoplanes nipponensis TaxID=135950 RepID=UPI0031ECD146